VAWRSSALKPFLKHFTVFSLVGKSTMSHEERVSFIAVPLRGSTVEKQRYGGYTIVASNKRFL
jgi:hypothetical protein